MRSSSIRSCFTQFRFCCVVATFVVTPLLDGQVPAPRLGEFPKLHLAIPDERIYRRFLTEQAINATEAEKLKPESRAAMYSSVAGKLRLRANDVLLIMRESQRHAADQTREFARIESALSAQPGNQQASQIEKVRVRSQLTMGTMKRIRAGLDSRSRNRLEATLLTQYDTPRPRPAAKEVVR